MNSVSHPFIGVILQPCKRRNSVPCLKKKFFSLFVSRYSLYLYLHIKDNIPDTTTYPSFQRVRQMCPLISNIFLPEAKTRSNIFQLVFLSLKKIHPWNNESEIYYHYSHKRKLFHFLSLGMSISITFFFLYEMSVY